MTEYLTNVYSEPKLYLLFARMLSIPFPLFLYPFNHSEPTRAAAL